MQDEQKKSTADSRQGLLSLLLSYLRSKSFGMTILGILGAMLVLFFLVKAGLSWYTNHGQRLEVGKYEGLTLENASKEIKRADFRVEVIDSVFLVDKPPHLVLKQDPQPGAFVKENRRIYLTVTKAIPDEVELPALTGTYNFDRYVRKLSMLDISGKIKATEYSSQYQPNTILKVFYQGQEISESALKAGFSLPKGSELEFIVTSREGGLADVPDLKCRTFEEAKFFIENYRLRLGRVEADASVTDREMAYVWRQDPPVVAGLRVPFESEVHLFLTANRPESCEEL